MAAVDAWNGQVPPLTDELPLLSVLYPLQWERDWVRVCPRGFSSLACLERPADRSFVRLPAPNPQKVSWQPGFCNETILYAVALCAGYLVFCFGGKWVMSNLKPFDLKM